MFQVTTKTFEFGGQQVTLETGRIARQATGAVMVTMGGVQVLCTVVGAKSQREGQDFFPLSVHYQEKYYAVGRIPGGFFKREARPTEKETLTSRLIDRPIRPLFPKGYMNEVQVICTVMSADKINDPDIAAMLGTSAALAISGLPFQGPIGGARVGFTEAAGYILNPTYEQLATSELDMVVAGTSDAVLMVESQAQELSEDEMLGAVLFAHQEMQVAIAAINDLVAEAGKPKWDWQAPQKDEALIAQVRGLVGEGIAHHREIALGDAVVLGGEGVADGVLLSGATRPATDEPVGAIVGHEVSVRQRALPENPPFVVSTVSRDDRCSPRPRSVTGARRRRRTRGCRDRTRER
jgi:polyribonucleotide nucleotidyltransferase